MPPWKVVLPGRASPEVYDLVADPGEQRSMAVDHPALVGYARQRLEALRVFHPPDVGTRLDVDAEVVDRLRRLGYVVE